MQAVGEDGRAGWGESCPRSYVTGETIETAKTALLCSILPPMINTVSSNMHETVEFLTSELAGLERSRQAAFCAAELAVLDLAGKTFGLSAGTVAGPIARRRVRYGAVIAASSCAQVRKYAALIRLFRFREVKVKVHKSLEQNVKLLETARRFLGRTVVIRIDANGAWSADEAVRQLKQLSRYRLAAVEQPVSAEDIQGMQQVTAAGLLPVVADESLCSVHDAETLIERRAANIFNLRVSKCGGLINTMRIYRKAALAGLGCHVGAQVGETALLSAAGRHLATRCPSILWCEGSYGLLLLKHDIARPGITVGVGGRARAVDRPGIGVAPDMRRIARSVTDVTEVY